MANIAHILDKPSNQIERPKPLPMGNYIFVVKGLPRYDKSSKKQTEFAEHTLQVLQPQEDVDQEALEEWMRKEDGTTKSITDATMKATFYLTEAAAFMYTDFLNACQAGEETDSLRFRGQSAAGCQVIGTVVHRPSQDGKTMFAEVRSFAKIGGDADDE